MGCHLIPSDSDDESCSFAIADDPELKAQGWERRHLADTSRVDESVQLYKSMGYEVKLREVNKEDFAPACQQCAISASGSFVLLYTRKNSTS